MDFNDTTIRERIIAQFRSLKEDLGSQPRLNFRDSELMAMAVEAVETEDALSLLDDDARMLVQMTGLRMEFALGLPDLMNEIYGEGILDRLDDDQRQQAIAYLESTVFRGTRHQSSKQERLRREHACCWSATDNGFRIVKILKT